MMVLTWALYALLILCQEILSDEQLDALRILAKQVMKQLDLKLSLEKEKKYTNLLEEKRQQLLELNLVKSKMFSIIAHDLKTPLRNLT